MAEQPTSKTAQQPNSSSKPPTGKIVVSSVVTRASLLKAISERNPIIAGRTKSGDNDS